MPCVKGFKKCDCAFILVGAGDATGLLACYDVTQGPKPIIANSSRYGHLNGQCHEISEYWFFHQIAPPGPIRGTLWWFWFFHNISDDICQGVGSAVYDTPRNCNSAVYHTPPNGDWGCYHTPWNDNSAVYLTPQSLCQKMFCYIYSVLFNTFQNNSKIYLLVWHWDLSYTGELQLGGIRHAQEWWLGGVSYTAE